MRKFFLSTCAGFAVTLLPFPSFAQDKPPVVIEMFSSSACTSDLLVQKDVQKLLENNPSAILVNCRTASLDQKETRKDHFEDPFCTQKAARYFKKLHMFANRAPMIIVNGKYEASNTDLTSALNMAQSVDQIKKIKLKKENDALAIDISAAENLSQTGELYLFAYAPTQEITVGHIEQDTAETQGENLLPQSVPFEGAPIPYNEFYFRPVVKIIKLENWTGKEKTLTYAMKNFEFLETDIKDLSFITVLYNDKNMGDVIAVGELKSAAELATSTSQPQKAEPSL